MIIVNKRFKSVKSFLGYFLYKILIYFLYKNILIVFFLIFFLYLISYTLISYFLYFCYIFIFSFFPHNNKIFIVLIIPTISFSIQFNEHVFYNNSESLVFINSVEFRFLDKFFIAFAFPDSKLIRPGQTTFLRPPAQI